MYYYKARMYSPTLGRFMQTDPIGYSDGINWYAYVGNDPVNRGDPTGLGCDNPKENGCGDPDIVVTGHKPNCGSFCTSITDSRDIQAIMDRLSLDYLKGFGPVPQNICGSGVLNRQDVRLC